MSSGNQMNRLLQGDVGSGKTIVAILSLLIALDNNCQGCLMAPTEILAKQHFFSFIGLLKNQNIDITSKIRYNGQYMRVDSFAEVDNVEEFYILKCAQSINELVSVN